MVYPHKNHGFTRYTTFTHKNYFLYSFFLKLFIQFHCSLTKVLFPTIPKPNDCNRTQSFLHIHYGEDRVRLQS